MGPAPIRIVVLAKAPLAGHSKTRLTPPYTPAQAAAVASACLQDTLDTIDALIAGEPGWDCLISLAGPPGPWLPTGIPVVQQCEGTHGVRIGRAIEDGVHPAGRRAAHAVLLIGMDTPQVTPELLRTAAGGLSFSDATLGPAEDGGWWLLGLQARHARRATTFLAGIPTSTAATGDLQRRRLLDHRLRLATVPTLRDIDTAEDLDAVASDLVHQGRTTRLTTLAEDLRTRVPA